MIMEFSKLKRKFVNKLTLFFTFFIITTSQIYSKSGYWHSMDMLSVLGLNSVNNQPVANQNYEKLKDMFDSINNFIDQNISNEFYTELKDSFKLGCKNFEKGYNDSLDVYSKYIDVLKNDIPELDEAVKKAGQSLDFVRPATVEMQVNRIDSSQVMV